MLSYTTWNFLSSWTRRSWSVAVDWANKRVFSHWFRKDSTCKIQFILFSWRWNVHSVIYFNSLHYVSQEIILIVASSENISRNTQLSVKYNWCSLTLQLPLCTKFQELYWCDMNLWKWNYKPQLLIFSPKLFSSCVLGLNFQNLKFSLSIPR